MCFPHFLWTIKRQYCRHHSLFSLHFIIFTSCSWSQLTLRTTLWIGDGFLILWMRSKRPNWQCVLPRGSGRCLQSWLSAPTARASIETQGSSGAAGFRKRSIYLLMNSWWRDTWLRRNCSRKTMQKRHLYERVEELKWSFQTKMN